MSSRDATSIKTLSIHEAAEYLGVATKTLRRWEESGVLLAQRTEGGHRRYDVKDLQAFKRGGKKARKEKKNISPGLASVASVPSVGVVAEERPQILSPVQIVPVEVAPQEVVPAPTSVFTPSIAEVAHAAAREPLVRAPQLNPVQSTGKTMSDVIPQQEVQEIAPIYQPVQPLHPEQKKVLRFVVSAVALVLSVFAYTRVAPLAAAELQQHFPILATIQVPFFSHPAVTQLAQADQGNVLGDTTSIDNITFGVNVPSFFRDKAEFLKGIIVSGSASVSGAVQAGTLQVRGLSSLADTNVNGNLTLTGTLQSLAKKVLTIGGNTTGNITLAPLNGGAGAVTNNQGDMNLTSTNFAYKINNVPILTSSKLGDSVTTSSLTTVGALSSGTIVSGFGQISTGNSITGTIINGTTSINTGGGTGTIRIDASGNLSNIGTITASGAITFSNLSTGIVHANGSGLLSSSAVNLNSADVTGILPSANGGTGADLSTGPPGTVPYFSATGVMSASAVGTSGYCLTSGGSGAPSWQSCVSGSSSSNVWTSGSGAIFPLNSTMDLLIGGQSTASAKFAFTNANSGTPTFTISGTAGNTYLTANGTLQTTNNQNLTIGGNTTGNITLSPLNGTGTVTISSLTNAGAVLYTSGTGQLGQSATGTSGFCLLSGGSAAPTWANCNGASGSLWNQASGAIFPQNGTVDFLLGGQATTSAKFAITNVNSGTPVATLSAGLVGGTYITADGTIQTTNNQSMMIGGNSTGNITIAPLNGSGSLTLNGNTTVVTSNTFGVSSLNTVGGLWYSANSAGTAAQTAQGASNTVLHGNGAAAPTFSSVSLTADVINVLPISNGGTNTNTPPTAGAVAYGTGTAYAFNSVGTSGFCLVSGGSGAPTWISCSTASANVWASGNGAIYPQNSTNDVFFGGQATTSAKFAFINVNSGTPVASVSAGLGGATYITADGKIATTTRQSLTLGDPTGTGNVIINPAGNVGIGTTAPAALLSVGATSQFQVSSSGVITAPTSSNTINGLVINSGALSGITGYTQTAGNFAMSGAGTFGTGTGAVSLNGDTTIASGKNFTVTSLNTAGGVIYANSSGQLLNNGVGTSGFCLTSAGAGAPTWSSCSGSAGNQWNTSNGAIFPYNSTADLLIGGQATASAKFAVINMNSGTPTASISAGAASAGGAYLTATGTLQTTQNQSLTIGGNSTGNITISPLNGSGSTTFAGSSSVIISSLTNAGGVVYTTGTGQLAQSATGTGGFCLISGGSGAPTWANCNGASGSVFNLGNGAIFPQNSTVDFLIGGQASSSAKFAVLNVNSGTPAASVSAGISGGAYLAADGTEQTTNNQTLTLGGNTTGNITLSPLNGSGTTTNTGTFNLSSGKTYQINNVNVLSSTTLGTGVTTSSLTTVGALASGSIANGFGTIATANTITGTTLNGTTGINTGAGAGTQRIDASGNLANIGTITAGGLITANGGLTVASGQNFTLAGLTVGQGILLTDTSGVVSQIAQGASNTVLHGNGASAPTFSQVSLTSDVTGTLGISNGGTNGIAAPTAGAVAYGTGTAYAFSGVGNSGQCLTSGGSGAPTWQACAAGTSVSNVWTSGSGAIFPQNSTMDLLVGGQATTSAKFAFINVNSGTPTASISANSGNNALYLTGDGTLATTNRETLTIGNSATYNTTGNVLINPNGTGFVGIGTTTPANALDIRGSSVTEQIKASGGNAQLTLDGTNQESVFFSLSGTSKWSEGLFSTVFSNDWQLTDQVGGGVKMAFGPGATGLISINPNGNQGEKMGFGTSSPLGSYDFRSVSGNSAVASFSGQSSFATGVFDQSGSGDILTASVSGLTKFTVNNAGNVVINNLNTAGGVVYTSATGQLSTSAQGTSGFCLTSGAAGAPTWQSCAAGTSVSNVWTSGSGAIYPQNSTMDLLVGGQATTSAKFAVLNMNTGTPTASISANSGNIATYLTGDGTLATTNRQSLTIGNSSTYNTTGNVLINPNGTGFVGIGTSVPAGRLEIGTNASSNTPNLRLLGSTSGSTGGAGIELGDGVSNSVNMFIYRNNSNNFVIATSGNSTQDLAINPRSNLTITPALSTGNVGINTTSPGAKLDLEGAGGVFGTNTADLFRIVNTDTTATNNVANMSFFAKRTGAVQTPIASISGVLTDNGGTTYTGALVFSTAGTAAVPTERVRIDSNGNVGIGTSTFGTNNKLLVNPYNHVDNAATALIGITSTSNKGLVIQRFAFGQTANYQEWQDESGSVLASIDPTGKIRTSSGIGSAPAYSFQSDTTSGMYSNGSLGLAFSSNGNQRMLINSSGQVSINGLNTAGQVLYTDSSGTLTGTGAGTSGFCLTSGGSGAPTWTSCATNTSNLWTSGSGAIYPQNSTMDLLVGGQATTSAKFAFINVNSGTPTATIAGSVSGNALSMTGDGSINTTLNRTLALNANGGSVSVGATGANAVLSFPNTTSGFVSNFTETFATNSFTINGANEKIAMTQNDITLGSSSGDQMIVSNGSHFLQFKVNGATNAMYFANGGNIGVGNASPLAHFDIQGAGSGTLPVASMSGATTNASLIVDQSGSGDILTASVSGLTKFVVTNAGNVGIGTSQPANALDIISPAAITERIRTTSGNAVLTLDGTNQQSINFFLSGSNKWSEGMASTVFSNDWQLTDQTGGGVKMAFGPGATGLISINPNGNQGEKMGFATSSPLSSYDFRSVSGTTAVASFSGQTSLATLLADQSGVGDIFDASVSGLMKFKIANSGNVTAVNSVTIQTSGSTLDLASATNGNTFIEKFPQDATSTACASAAAEGLIFQNTGGTQVGHMCIDGPSSATPNKLRFYAEQFNATSTDLAENYSDATNSLVAGDVVVVDPNTTKGVKKSTTAYDAAVLGIISTSPGVTLTGIDETGKTDLINPKPVALAGRIPVNVSANSPAIKSGDMLTTSTDPGKVMKATKAGVVVAQALEGWNPASGKTSVLAFARTHYYDPDLSLTASGELVNTYAITATNNSTSADLPYTLKLATGGLSDRVITAAQGIVANMTVGSLTADTINTNNLNIKGKSIDQYITDAFTQLQASSSALASNTPAASSSASTAQDAMSLLTAPSTPSNMSLSMTATQSAALFNQSLNNVQLSASDIKLNVTASTLSSYLQVQGSSYLGQYAAVNNGFVIGKGLTITDNSIDYSAAVPADQRTFSLMHGVLNLSETGLVKVNGDLDVTGRVSLEDKDAAGLAVIKAGDTQVTVTFNRAYSEVPVITATADNANIKFGIKNKSITGFTIYLAQPAASDEQLSWIALQVKNAQTFQSGVVAGVSTSSATVSSTPTPTPSAIPTPTPNPSATPLPTPAPTPDPAATSSATASGSAGVTLP